MKKRILEVWREALRVTALKRKAFFLSADVVLISLSIFISFSLRFDGDIPAAYWGNMGAFILLSLMIKMSFIAGYGLYNITWRFFSIKEFLKLFQALFLAFMILGAGYFLFKPLAVYMGMPRSVFLLDFNFSIVFLCVLRISKRAYRELRLWRFKAFKERTKVLIIGAGAAGEHIGREMIKDAKSKYYPVGYVDDNPTKKGIDIHGIKVLGGRGDLRKIINANGIDEILIAMPSAGSDVIRKFLGIIRSSGIEKKIRILPSMSDLVDGNVNLTDIKEIQVEDLLGRDPVKIDFASIRDFLRGKCVLVTGAGGSIGSEVVKAILQFEPRKAVLLDCDETELFYVLKKAKNPTTEILPIVADVRDRVKMDCIFEQARPQIVIHAAAQKHVPILEHYPEEAVKTNILGTKILGEMALKYSAEKFVYISTDKAINPTSVMGASKRVGEEILKVFNTMNGTRYISVRFGNVLGSRGSVIPVFAEQIKNGGPVTVTHKDMKRYFMSVSEAVLLILEAAALGKGGEAYILDMGEPVKIDDLAREMIKLSGLEPDVDISIAYTGLRGGEKLYEELLTAEEGSESTGLAKILRAKSSNHVDGQALIDQVEKLINLCRGHYLKEDAIAILREIVPTYQPDGHNLNICNW